MKKIITFFFLSIFLISLFSAQETTTEGIATQEDVEQAGVTPDQPLWGIDVALERITELFSENAKLQHAMERLAEVKVMIEQNKLKQAERSRINFERIRLTLKNQSEIEEHTEFMGDIGTKISQISSGNLTSSDIVQIKGIIEIHKIGISEEAGNIRAMGKYSTK